ncbi:MAG: MBL fold metallo-hydrolase [Rhodoferax sp.]|nr:MBL fold metallo-hydrolase [Rhodoferax sp.]MCF8211046.1 MBL fold metallo-hydrolase [Rhodoferax sp.]
MHSAPASTLPDSITVLQRGWLSSNNVVIRGAHHCALIDSGYELHAAQTLALITTMLQGRPLDVLVNTHLHSDHCGGNAALQASYPDLRTLIPPGQAQHVRDWNPDALTYVPTGQSCPRFVYDDVLRPGTSLQLGDLLWQVHAAPGHDTHSVILFEPVARILVAADALWERGFGVVFPELDGEDAFDAVAQTIDLIEALQPAIVIPGHGAPFTHVDESIAVARKRLHGFVTDPVRHVQYAIKVLLKFRLLQVQQIERQTLIDWALATPYFVSMFQRHFAERDFATGVDHLVQDLVRSGSAALEGDVLHNR